MKTKRIIFKKIISIFLIFTMLINICPNLSLLMNKVEASTSDAKVILEVNEELGIIEGEEYTGFAMDISIQNFNATSFVLPITYDDSKIKPALPFYRRGVFQDDFDGYAADIGEFVEGQVDEEIIADDASSLDSKMEDGYVGLEFLKTDGSNINVTEKTLICRVYFIIDDDSINSLSKINNSIISIDSEKCEIFDADQGQDIKEPADFAMIYVSQEEKEIESLKVSGEYTKEYLQGEALDLTNLIVTATYTDKTSMNLSAEQYRLSVSDKTELKTAGMQEITVTSTEKTDVSTTFKVLVFPNNIEAIYDETLNDIKSKLPEKFSWVEEETTKVGPAGTQQHKVKYTGTEDEFNKEKDITVKVAKKKIIPNLDTLSGVVGQHLSDIKLPTVEYGTLTWVDNDTELTREGIQTFNATCKLKDDDNYTIDDPIQVTVNVVAKKVERIEIDDSNVTKSYIEGQKFNPEGLKVTVYYNDETQQTITITDKNSMQGVTFAPNGELTTANNEVTVSYGGKSAEKKISIKVEKKVVTSIKVTTNPTTEYKIGDTLDLSKMVVEATYNDNSKKTLNKNEYTLSIEDGTELTSQKVSELNTLPATKSITITYSGTEKGTEDITTEINITVKDYVKEIKLAKNSEEAKSEISITGKYGTELSQLLADNHVNYVVIYGSGKTDTKSLTEQMVSRDTTYQKNTTSEQTLTIKYTDNNSDSATKDNEFTATLKITLTNEIESIKVTEVPNAVYVAGDTLNCDGIKVEATYIDKNTEILTTDKYTIEKTELNKTGLNEITVKYNDNNAITTKYYVLVTPNNLQATYGQKLSEVTDKPNNYTWVKPTDTVGNATEGDNFNRHNATYTLQHGETILVGKDTKTEGNQVNCELGVKVKKAKLTINDLVYDLSAENKTYNGQEQTAQISIKSNLEGTGEITSIEYYKNGVKESGNPVNAGDYTVKVSVSDGDNYEGFELTQLEGTFKIKKATLTAENFNFSIEDKTYNGSDITVNLPTIRDGINGAGKVTKVEYKQSGEKVEGNPKEKGTYEVYVVVEEGDNYLGGTILLGSFAIESAKLPKDVAIKEKSNPTYDGEPKEVELENLPEDAKDDVTIKYYDEEGNEVENPTDAGEYTVKVEVKEGNYKEETRELGKFTIEKADFIDSYLDKTVPENKTYDGKPIAEATATVKNNIEGAGKVTVEYVDSEGNQTTVPPTNAGTYTVKVTVTEGKNYNAFEETIGTFKIEKADLEEKDLTYTMPDERTYDGTATKVEVTAPDGAGEVTVKYYKDGEEVENPTNAGTYTVKVTVTEGKNYNKLTETVIGTFTINKATLTANDFNANIPANKEYDGDELTANPQIKESVKGAGNQVTVEYYKNGQKIEGNPTEVGEYTVKVSVNEGTNYEAAKDLELGKFSITKTQLKDEDITFSKPDDLVYDGTEKEATVDVPDGAGDVTVKYVDEEGNESTTPPTDAGKYRVVVDIDEGDDYAGVKDKEVGSFEISKKDLTIDDLNTTKPSGKTYDGKPISPAATASVKDNIEGAGKVTVEYVDSEGNETTVPPTNAGEYTVKVTVTEGKNYNALAETVIGTFTIEKADLDKEDLTYTMPAERTYDGTATEVEVTAPQGAGEVTVKYYKDGEEVTNPTNAGTYTVKASVADSENYNALEETELGTFTINKATPSITIDTITIIYEDTLAGKLPTRKDGTLTWQKDNNFDENEQYEVGTYNFKASFKPSDTENYNTVNDIDVKVIVNKKHINPPTVGTLTGIEGQALKDIASQLPAADTYGKVVWVNEEEILLPEKTTYQAKYELNDTNNYETTNPIEVTVNVKAKEVERIEITTEPSDTDYIEGQTFDPTGMVIKVYYNDGTFAEIKENYTDKGVTFTPNGALTTDDATVTVDFRGKTASQAITVEEDYVIDIIVTAPSKLEYNYGDAINLAGGKITRVWASGVKANDTIDMTKAMLSNSDIPNFDNLNSLGIKEITVKYENITKTNAFQITVNDYVSSIEIKNPDRLQTEYVYGDTINVKDKDTNQDLYIVVKYAGGTPSKEVVLTTEMLSGFSMTKLGQQTVTVTYEEKTDSYTINVKDEVIGIEITKEPARRVYKINDTVNFSDIVVRDVMKSGEEGSILTAQEYTISTVSTAVAGEQTVTVTKKNTNFTDTFKIKVIDATTEMNITDLPKDNYNFGEELDLSDGKITVKTQTGDKELPMTDSSVTVSGYNPHQLGEQTVTVTYTYTEETDNGIETKTMTDTFTVNVEDYWVEGTIKITAQPDKLTYKYGEPINLAGGKVARVMASGAIEDETNITGEMISGYDPKRLGIQTITVSYMGGTDTFTVTVVDETIGISMNTLPNKTEYTQGEGLNLTGATINVTRLSGTEVVEITSGMISGYNPNKVGPQVITVTYEGKTTSFVVNVKAKPVKPNKPSTPSNPSKPDSSENETYTVTFVDYDGTELKTETVAKGKSATAPEAPERKGYKFLGWNEEFDVVERDLTVVAEYEEIERAKVNIPGNDNNDNNNDNVIEVEKGKDLDLSDVTLTIKDEEGNDIDEIPVTEDMISGFDPNKVGTQTVTVTYVDENGFEYTATFKVRVTRPVETLGVKDEIKEDDSSILKDIVLPVTAGVGGVALLMLLIAWVTRKNVEIYALTEKERKLIGTEKISKNNARIELDKYEKDLENANIEVVLSQKITEKLDEEMVDIVFKGKKATYKVKYEEGKKFSIKIKNM